MVNPKKRADGRWYVAIYLGKDIYGKKQYQYIYAHTEKECKQKAINFEYQKQNNLVTNMVSSKLVTVEDFWKNWLDSRIGLADSTISEYTSVKNKHLKKIMPMKAADVNYKVVQRLYIDIYKENNNNPKIVKKVARVFNCFLRKMAVDRSCPIPRDILDGVELPSCPKFQHYMMTTRTYNDIIQSLKENYEDDFSDTQYLYSIALITSCGGLRIGEATALMISDIDFENNTIKINKQQLPVKGDGYVIIEKTKSEAGRRTIVITPTLKEFLLQHIEKQKQLFKDLEIVGIQPHKIKIIKEDKTIEYINSNELLTTTNKGTLVKKNTVQRNWKTFRENLGYEEQIRIHDFRRYFATQMMCAGVPDTIAKSQLGHTKIDMTQYYQNDTEEIKQKYISSLVI